MKTTNMILALAGIIYITKTCTDYLSQRKKKPVHARVIGATTPSDLAFRLQTSSC
ncbi:hypothetical protein VVR12_03170 [Rothia sp. LK2588]|uniref:hypothetical protein n=1 Tax=Rothia sp. LK2588 TaxID=3114369 RepID=UPI0034CE1CB3